MRSLSDHIRNVWRASAAGLFGFLLVGAAVCLVVWHVNDNTDTLSATYDVSWPSEPSGNAQNTFSAADTHLFGSDFQSGKFWKQRARPMCADYFLTVKANHPAKGYFDTTAASLHDTISWPKTHTAANQAPIKPSDVHTGVEWPVSGRTEQIHDISWPLLPRSSQMTPSHDEVSTEQLFSNHIRWPLKAKREDPLRTKSVKSIEKEVAQTLVESEDALREADLRAGSILSQHQPQAKVTTSLVGNEKHVTVHKQGPSPISKPMLLQDKLTDDDDICGLACGNASKCVDACLTARAHLHGWASKAPTDDEAICTKPCGPHAPHCVRRCVKERARLHGWADVTPTEDEQICTYDCGPFTPRCVHSCVAQRAKMHGWVDTIPTSEELTCTKACGPYAPHCVRSCVRDRARTTAPPAIMPTPDAGAKTEEIPPCVQACGDSHVCVRACERARALAVPSDDEKVCAQACGDSHICNVACMRQRAPPPAAPAVPATAAPADGAAAVCAKACGDAPACVQACLRQRQPRAAAAASPDEALCGKACGDSHVCVRACVRERALMRPSADEEVCSQACGDSHACMQACARERADSQTAAAPAAAPPPAAVAAPADDGDDAAVCASACGDSQACLDACNRERRRLRAPVSADDSAVCGRACGDSHTCYKACIRERALVSPTAEEALCAHACGDSHACTTACMRQRAADDAKPSAAVALLLPPPAAGPADEAVDAWCAKACGDSRLCAATCKHERSKTATAVVVSTPGASAHVPTDDEDNEHWCANACADSHLCMVTCVSSRAGAHTADAAGEAAPSSAAPAASAVAASDAPAPAPTAATTSSADGEAEWCGNACGDSNMCYTTCTQRVAAGAIPAATAAKGAATAPTEPDAAVEAWCEDICGDSHVCVTTCVQHNAAAPSAPPAALPPPPAAAEPADTEEAGETAAWCSHACEDSELCMSTCIRERTGEAAKPDAAPAAQAPESAAPPAAAVPEEEDEAWCANACGDSHLCVITCNGRRASAKHDNETSPAAELPAPAPAPATPVEGEETEAWCAHACGDSNLCLRTCIGVRSGASSPAAAAPTAARPAETAVMFTLSLAMSLESFAGTEANYTAAIAAAAGCDASAVEVLSVQAAATVPAAEDSGRRRLRLRRRLLEVASGAAAAEVVQAETEVHTVGREEALEMAARLLGPGGLAAIDAGLTSHGLPPAVGFAKPAAACSRGGGDGAEEAAQWVCEAVAPPEVNATATFEGEAPAAADANGTLESSEVDSDTPTVTAIPIEQVMRPPAQPLESAPAQEPAAVWTPGAGATCGQGTVSGYAGYAGGDASVASTPAQTCPVLARPDWGKMKNFPVDGSPQVANGCVEYVCRSVRKVGEEFFDEKIMDGADDVLRDVPSTVQSVQGVASRVQSSVKGWVGRTDAWIEAHAARRGGIGHGAAGGGPLAGRTLGGGQKLAGVPAAAGLDPRIVAVGSEYESVVRACMYPSMTCAEQLASARSLCRDDQYWRRRVEGFNCTGGYQPPPPAGVAADRWRLVTHFLISMLLVAFFGVVVWLLVARPAARSAAGPAAPGAEEMERPGVVRVTL